MRAIPLILALALLAGCASKPTCIEYYPPATPAEQRAGHGAVKLIDYRKPASAVSVFGFSIF